MKNESIALAVKNHALRNQVTNLNDSDYEKISQIMMNVMLFEIDAQVEGKIVKAEFSLSKLIQSKRQEVEKAAEEVSKKYPNLPSIMEILHFNRLSSQKVVVVADFEKKELTFL